MTTLLPKFDFKFGDTTPVGAINRPIDEKLSDFASIKDFGAVGDGIADDSAAIQAAIDSLGNAGGTVYIPNGMKCYVNANITVNHNVTLKGPYSKVGSPGSNSSIPYDTLSSIRLNSTYSIILNSGAGIDGVLIYKSDLTFPIPATGYTFAGTAITGAGDDCFVINSMILGFNQAFYSTDVQRIKIIDVNIDCQNGVWIDNCLDISRVVRVHCWPFAAIGGTYTLARTGNAFYWTTLNDQGRAIDCFSYGYQYGFRIADTGMVLIGCNADTALSINTGQIGFYVTGNAYETKFIGCQSLSQESGYRFNLTNGLSTTLVDCDSVSCSSTGIIAEQGDVTVLGGRFSNTPTGIAVLSQTSNLIVEGCRFESIGVGGPISVDAATGGNQLIQIGKNNYTNWNPIYPVVNSYASIPTAASATTMSIPSYGNQFLVTGTTTVTNIVSGWAGREITLLFNSIVNITDNANLHLNGNFTSAVDSTLKLVSNGYTWQEVSRSVN